MVSSSRRNPFAKGTFLKQPVSSTKSAMKRMARRLFSLVAVAILSVPFCVSAEAYTYHALGTGYAYDINNSGAIVGSVLVSGLEYPAYTSGFSTTLSAITGFTGTGKGVAYSISQNGLVTGFYYPSSKSSDTQIFGWNSATSSLSVNTGVDFDSVGYGINSSGKIAGWSYEISDAATFWGTITSSATSSPFLAADPSMHTWYWGINESGIAVGSYYDSTMTTGSVPMICNGSTYSLITTASSGGSAYAIVGYAYDINSPSVGNYKVVGEFAAAVNPTFFRHAFVYDSGTGILTDLGTLSGDMESVAYGINNNGDIVGASIDASGNYRAVIWSAGGSPAALGTGLQVARSINDDGDIVGYGTSLSSNTAWCLEY